MNKKVIREMKLTLLKQLDLVTKTNWDNIITEKFFASNYFTKHHVFACYFPLSYEVSTLMIIEQLLQAKKKVCLPKVAGEQLVFYEIKSINNLIHHEKWNIMEPAVTDKVINITEIEVFLIPLLAYSSNYQRIGHGYGYYDRYLANVIKDQVKIGLAYRLQLITTKLKFAFYDQVLDDIITN